jgi:hypothetical protein
MSSVPAAGEPVFRRRTVFWGVLASLLAAAGFALLSTYAPEFRQGQQGGSALSRGGTGFAGLFELMTLLGDEPETVAGLDELSVREGLVVVTIAPQSDPETLRTSSRRAVECRRCSCCPSE